MANRVAVIDIGTNTFHLLITEACSDQLFKEVWHEQKSVKLGEGGINEGIIQPDAYQRGIIALADFQQQIERYQVSQTRAIATSAVRCAANGQQFIDEVRSLTGIVIETISGDTEARYIYQGVNASGCLQAANSLIVDIGGGSVEFIIGNAQEIIWKQSFEIGAARLMNLFHKTDPVTPNQIQELYQYLDTRLLDLFTAFLEQPVTSLIGSSGAFETFAELAETSLGNNFDLKRTVTYQFNPDDFIKLTDNIIRSSHEERAATPGIIPVRVDMIVVASLLTRYLIEKFKIADVVMSAYSLKEGVLADLYSM